MEKDAAERPGHESTTGIAQTDTFASATIEAAENTETTGVVGIAKGAGARVDGTGASTTENGMDGEWLTKAEIEVSPSFYRGIRLC